MTKTVQENIALIREISMAMLQSSDSHMIELAMILSDRVMDIEVELYNPEPEVNKDKDALIYGSHTTFNELIKYEDIDYSSWTINDWTQFWQNKIISEGTKNGKRHINQ